MIIFGIAQDSQLVRTKLMNMRDEYFSLVESHQLQFVYYISTCPKHYLWHCVPFIPWPHNHFKYLEPHVE